MGLLGIPFDTGELAAMQARFEERIAALYCRRTYNCTCERCKNCEPDYDPNSVAFPKGLRQVAPGEWRWEF